MNGLTPSPPIGGVPNSPAIDAAPPVAGTRTEDLPLVDRIAVLEQVLSMLDTLTAAGQRHMMRRIATFVHQQLPGPVGHLNDREARELLGLAMVLGRDSEMALPEVGAFSGHAREAFARLLARETGKESRA